MIGYPIIGDDVHDPVDEMILFKQYKIKLNTGISKEVKEL
jgi:hypothetical protein